MTDEKKRQADLIGEAFRRVVLGDGVGLMQARGLDDYADEKMLAEYRAKDEKRDWAKIPVSELNRKSSTGLTGFTGLDSEWERSRFEIVVTGNLAKFRQNAEMGRFLAETGSKVLVEAAPRDQIWGIGMGRDHACAEDPARWRGLNLLGFALMEVRGRLGAGD